MEDIVDTGRTLKALVSHLEQQGAASVKIVTLLNKQARRVIDVQADYVGFQVSVKNMHDAYVSGRCDCA